MIVISTPTGQIGHQVLADVLGSGQDVRAIARDPSRISAQIRAAVDVVQGSTDDVDVVTRAFAGAERVFWLVPPVPTATSVQDHVLDFVRPLREAIISQGVKRVIAVSSLGRGLADNAGQISAIFAMDALIETTGVNYRSLQPPGLMENMLRQVESIKNQGVFFATISADRKTPTCATRDVAAIAARLLLDDSWSGQAGVPILGPEDLSQDDMARIMSDVLERPIRYQRVSGEALRATLVQHGMSEAWAQGLIDMAAAVDQGIYNAEPRTQESSTPTTFRQWCEDVLKPAVLA